MTLDAERKAEAELLEMLAGDPNTFTPDQWVQLAAQAHRLIDLLMENPGPGDECQSWLCAGVLEAARDPFRPNLGALKRGLRDYRSDPNEYYDYDFDEDEYYSDEDYRRAAEDDRAGSGRD